MKKTTVAAALAVLAVGAYLIAGNIGGNSQESGPTAADGAEVKQMVADISSRKLAVESASITSRELIVGAETAGEKKYALPEDEFFLSIAPYLASTHPCATHSLTGCQGELANEQFSVYIEDAEGNKVFDDEVTSHSNGFIDLWLPRGQTFNVTIGYNGKQAVSELSTYDENDTCIATMQLL